MYRQASRRLGVSLQVMASLTTVSCVIDIELKGTVKFLAQKFATGASVTQNGWQGQEEIVVQGDVSDGVLELMEGNTDVFKGIPAVNVD